jgi:8-oxo-dGTP pyrophosphatase MutT (NUDIX family)
MQKNRKELKQFLKELLMSYDKDVQKEIDVAGAVIYRYNTEEKIPEILMIRRAPDDNWPNVWEFPRGKCDKNPKEKIIDCLKREVREETGLKFKVISYLNKYTYVADKGKRRSTQYNYLCKLVPSDQEIKLSKEHSECKWVSAKGQVDLLASGEIEDTLNLALERIVIQNVQSVSYM